MQIRYITKRANGRESIKSVDVTKVSLLIGRAPDCDVELPDLLVGLHHVKLTLVGATAQLEALGDHAIKVAGRLVKKAELRLDQPRVFEVGPFVLTLAMTGAAASIDVTRNEKTVDRSAKRDVREVFGLKSSLYSIRTASWLLALIIGVVALGFPIATFALNGAGRGAKIEAGKLWVAGELSTPHATLAKDCQSCHEQEFVSVRDESCLSCHKDTLHHAPPDRLRASSPDVSPFERGLMRISTMFARPPERCASCHVEHSGKDALVSDAQEGCTSCHADMSDRLSDTPLGDVSDFGRNHPQFHPTLVKEPSLTDPVLTTEWDVTLLDQARAKREELIGRADPGACDGLEIGGANFRGVAQLAQRPGGVPAEAQPGDNSGVVFPHAVHLDKDGCVAGLAARLGPKSGYDGPLTCANCHRPDGGGVLFEPINMEKDCAACHSLAFETVNGFTRTLRHGQPEEVIASMLDFYKASIVNSTYAPPAQLEQRKRPGDANQNRYSTLRSMTFATAGTRAEERVRAIFSKGGACFGCHEVKEPTMPGGIDYQITPVKLLDQFMPRGAFDHAAHSTSKLNCAQCHKAETSQTSADVLAPGVEICQECHKGQDAFAAVPSTCTMCHGFHSENPDMPTMKGAHRQRDASQRRVWAPDRAATETMLHAHAP